MNECILQALATFNFINIVEAYTGCQLGTTQISDTGTLSNPVAGLARLRFDRIEEVRFRNSEMPEVFYRTDASVVFLARKREAVARQLSLLSVN